MNSAGENSYNFKGVVYGENGTKINNQPRLKNMSVTDLYNYCDVFNEDAQKRVFDIRVAFIDF